MGSRRPGCEFVGGTGTHACRSADAVVVAAGALATPGLLLRSGVREAAGNGSQLRADRPPPRLSPGAAGRGPVRRDPGRAHGLSDHRALHEVPARRGRRLRGRGRDRSRIRSASPPRCRDEHGRPLWGEELVQTMRRYRYFTGLLTMVNDENNGTAWVDETAADRYSFGVQRARAGAHRRVAAVRHGRARGGRRQARVPHRRAQHPRPGRLPDGQRPGALGGRRPRRVHDVRRLFVGDGSVMPRTLSVNPSLTIMSLASRLAEYLDGGEHGYFEPHRSQRGRMTVGRQGRC